MTELDEKMKEYEQRFDDQFPLMLCSGMDDGEIIKEIERCLKKGEEYSPNAPDDAVF